MAARNVGRNQRGGGEEPHAETLSWAAMPGDLTPGLVNAANVESVIGTKTVKNGQMHLGGLLPGAARRAGTFIGLATKFMHESVPNYFARAGLHRSSPCVIWIA